LWSHSCEGRHRIRRRACRLAWLESAGWSVKNGAQIAPGEPAAKRNDHGQLVLAQRLRDALARLNAALSAEALRTNDGFVKVLGDETLRVIAQELVKTVRANVTIDWTLPENVRAQLRLLVKCILRKHCYPPDKQEQATQTVLEQAALLSSEWVSA
jgi:hypothetical protein